MASMESLLIHLSFVVLFLPLAGFTLLIFFGKRIPRADLIETGLLFIALAVSVYIMVQKVFFVNVPRIDMTFRWLDLGAVVGYPGFTIDLGIAIDNITAIMLVVNFKCESVPRVRHLQEFKIQLSKLGS